MITIYKKTDNGLESLMEPTIGSWINVIDPNGNEIACLARLGIPHDYITYSLDLDERPRAEREGGDQLILLRVPVYQSCPDEAPYITVPLGIILTPDFLLTVCKCNNEILEEFSLGRIRGFTTSKRNRFILQLLMCNANKYLSYLRQITKAVDILEDQLQQSTRNKEVLELLKYQKGLTYFTTALKSNELMLERLQRSQIFKAYPEDEDLLEDVITENQQAIEMTNIASNILSSMMDAFASIISNNLNSIMKFLASITIVLSLPTIIASFYGMNVQLPLQEHPFAFTFTLLLSLGIGVGTLWIFARRDWL